jgi:hypothetical protein
MVARGCHLVSEMCRCLAGPGLCQAGSWTHATHDKSLLNWHFFCYYIILTNSWFLRYSMIFLYWFSATASITSLAFQVRGVSIRWERRKLDEIAVGTLAVGSVKLSWDMIVEYCWCVILYVCIYTPSMSLVLSQEDGTSYRLICTQ